MRKDEDRRDDDEADSPWKHRIVGFGFAEREELGCVSGDDRRVAVVSRWVGLPERGWGLLC